jgi:hypothetical protein
MTKFDNNVRQVLMNELGLRRENIREEMRIIIREEVQKVMEQPTFQEALINSLMTNRKHAGIKYAIIERIAELFVAKLLPKIEQLLK